MRRAFALCLVLGSVAVSAAQNQQPIRVGANFVRVDVYPTRDGKVVEGLQADDFEVLEDNVPQKIESFEHVAPVMGPQAARVEPNSQRDMARALGDPKSRVFLLFLDGAFVQDIHARQINEPLRKFISTMIADDDLIGVMTSTMNPRQVAFGRKSEVLVSGLPTTFLTWGRKGMELDPELDKQQIQYSMCYPGGADVPGKMIARSRERNTLEALQDVVQYLGNIREERKAIVAVTEGWVLYREDPNMLEKRKDEAPLGMDKIKVGPTGQFTREDKRNSVNALAPDVCDRDRAYLASINNEQFLRDIIDDANRGNSTFYMIDPSGLTTRAPDRNQAMRTLAENTDGFAMLNSNDLDRGFARMMADMSSYYLLGYNATNSRPDGRFRTITVRVKQPGISVRARKGYRAPTAEEITAAREAVRPTGPTAAASSVQSALDELGRIRPNARFRVDAVPGPGPQPSLWVVGELMAVSQRPDEFSQGARAAIEASGGGNSSTATATLKLGERAFITRLDRPAGAAGPIDVRVRLSSEDGAALPLTESVRVDMTAASVKPVLFRRGPSTGPRMVPAASPSFSRTERVRLEIPVVAGKPGAGRVLDRGGLATQVPVTMSERSDEGSGQRWIVADVNLAPLSPGDYIIEMIIAGDSGESRSLTAIRVGR